MVDLGAGGYAARLHRRRYWQEFFYFHIVEQKDCHMMMITVCCAM